MFALALRTLRFRSTGFIASFLALFLGATIVMSFASLFDTTSVSSIDAADKEVLTTLASIVGGWVLLLVIFTVTSTLSVQVRQRNEEMALLKSIGATPGQIGRMIVGETLVLSLIATILAIPASIMGGRALIAILSNGGQISSTVDHSFGPIAIHVGFGVILVASLISAGITAWRTARMRAVQALAAASLGTTKMSKKRIVFGCVFLALGLDLAIVTATVMHGKKIDAMSTAGPAAIWFALGLAVLSPLLVRFVINRVAGPIERNLGTSGYLTVVNLRQRTVALATAVMPIIVFTGIALGALYMQSIENTASAAEGVAATTGQKSAETANLTVVSIISLFAAVMLVNTLISVTTSRRKEFGQQRLIGSTPRQVLRMATIEAAVLAATGVLFGTLAALVTIVPFSIARTSSVIPDGGVGIALGVVALAVVLTLGSVTIAVRRALRMPAVDAMTAA